MSDVTLPTPAVVEGMRERHAEQASPTTALTYCHACSDLWPCDAARLLALVDRLEVANHTNAAEAHRQLRASVKVRARLAAVLAECDRAEGEVTGSPRVARAALDRIRRLATGEAS